MSEMRPVVQFLKIAESGEPCLEGLARSSVARIEQHGELP